MQSDQPPAPPPPAPDPGLPPVAPPSGQMIVRLFLVPGLIVAGLVGLFLLGPSLKSWLGGMMGWGDSRSATQFLRDLDSTNKDIRWRAASDLSQILPRNPELAADAEFSLQLAKRLDRTLADSAEAEASLAKRWPELSTDEKASEEARMKPERDYALFLMSSLSKCLVPAGVSAMERVCLRTRGMEPDALLLRRGQALFILATMGNTLEEFDKLTTDEQNNILDQLQNIEGALAKQAKEMRDYLVARQKGKQSTLGVVEVVEACAKDPDPFIRKTAALAACFWYGTSAENKRIDDVLVVLSRDNGAGEDALAERAGKNPTSKGSLQLVTVKGFQVRPNAVIALARRGSPRINECLGVMETMLSPDKLEKIFVLKARGKDAEPDESVIVQTVLETLKSVARLKKKGTKVDFKRLLPLVEKLTSSDNKAIAAAAQETKLILGSKD